jgi:hypothetical protein
MEFLIIVGFSHPFFVKTAPLKSFDTPLAGHHDIINDIWYRV